MSYAAFCVGGGNFQRLSRGYLKELSKGRKLTKWLLRLESVLYVAIEYCNAGGTTDIYQRARELRLSITTMS